jgi:3-isopropylmalate/(R)-2-methylmalate dehydratase small subunit
VLNHPAYREAKILVTAENFGCGSSREMAVWALMDYGIRVVIGPSFGDIFFENCFKNGVLAVVLPADVAAGLRRALAGRPGATLTVDLETQTITGPAGEAIRFEIDAFRKEGLLTGQDEVEMTLARLPAIEAFEARRRDEMPWLG